MIDVVGGTYVERCVEPAWDRVLGSGVRGALALSKGGGVRLTTVVGPRHLSDLEDLAAAYGFEVCAHSAKHTISFSYVHCLSDPHISPRLDTITKQRLTVAGDIVLCYGMLDADITVRGRKVIYDPQGPQAPILFRSGESAADHLAIVANAAEARWLTNEPDLSKAATKLLERERADVVVVKAGLSGAIIAYGDSIFTVPAYESGFSWTLGSGDLFAAAFAEFWGRREFEPERAADLASRAVALYAERRAIPPLDPDELLSAVTSPFNAVTSAEIYLAGPFFTLPQRWLIEESRRALQGLGLHVRSPLHDVGIGRADEVAEKDIELLKRSDRVFAILDGLDAGTLYEVGYARSLGLPVIGLAQNVSQEDLKMMTGTGCVIVDDFATAITASAKQM